MKADILWMVKLEGVTLLNTWVILSVLPLISLLLSTEPYLNRGKLKYVLWGVFLILLIATYQINSVIGGLVNILSVISSIMYVYAAWFGYRCWNTVE